MNSYIDTLLTELRSLVADLGKDGGLISPSVYDTAQVLRLYPPKEGVEPALTWLLSQQHADGGWGSPETPYARAVPTLSAILALHAQHQTPAIQEAFDAGLSFLQGQAGLWAEIPLDALPIATEVVLPYLIEEALSCGVVFDRTPYDVLYRLRQQKLQRINQGTLRSTTPPAHSWEALSRDAASIMPDRFGGIGHSPAATAAWLRQAEQRPELAEGCEMARCYLTQAMAATGLDVPGVVPNVWPITGFELSYAPYALLITNLLHHPALQEVIAPVMDELWLIMRRGHGVSFGEFFTPDVDDTGLAMALLHATLRPVDPAAVLQFKNGDHFCTFHHELNPSVFANAHAIFGLAYARERHPAAEQFLLDRQHVDGRWLADKLHHSWLYPTLEVIIALTQWGHATAVQKAGAALLQHQRLDGGWGSGAYATPSETSYALIALATLHQRGLFNGEAQSAMQRGHHWLANTSRADTPLWIGKESYTPCRVDRIYMLSALLSVALESVPA